MPLQAEQSGADPSSEHAQTSRRFSLDENRLEPRHSQTSRAVTNLPVTGQQAAVLTEQSSQGELSEPPQSESQQPAQQARDATSGQPDQEPRYQSAAAGHDTLDSIHMQGQQGNGDAEPNPSLSVSTGPMLPQSPSTEPALPSEAEHEAQLLPPPAEAQQASALMQFSQEAVRDQAMPEAEPDQMTAADHPGQVAQDMEAGAGEDPAGLFAQLGPMLSAEPAADDVEPPEEGWIG